jgi:hypothetical protein
VTENALSRKPIIARGVQRLMVKCINGQNKEKNKRQEICKIRKKTKDKKLAKKRKKIIDPV